MERLRLFVYGSVQGVGFRFYTAEKARDLGLSGWVRNLEDGSVEIVAEGSREKLKELLSWAKSGPSFGRVRKVETVWGKGSGEFKKFFINF